MIWRAAAAAAAAALLAALLGALVPGPSPLAHVGFAALAAAVVGAAAAWLVTTAIRREVLPPLAALARAADEMAAGRAPARVDPGGPEELRRAARAFNAMAERLGERQAHLAEREEMLHSALGQMREGLILADAEGRLVFMNRAAQDLFDAAPPAPGRSVIETVHQYDLDALLGAVLRDRIGGEREIEVLGAQPRLLWVRADPLTAEGRLEGAVVVAQDLSEIRQADLLRRQFVANASHELRNPIATIRALAESLQDEGDPARREQRLEQIIAATDRLSRLSADILELSAIESGAAPLRFETVRVRDVIEEAIEQVRPRLEASGLALAIHAPDDLVVRADRGRLSQALVNLVENAVAYTERGSVEITAGRAPGTVTIAVRDTGIGIAPEHLPRVFERFYRVDPARSRAAGGTGLGLAIVKHIVLAHGGRVAAESTEARGSTFTITLPAPERA